MVDYRGIKIRNLKLTFAEGRVAHLEAAQNAQALRQAIEASSGDKDVFAFVDIGVNPNSRPIRNADYHTYEMAGMVTIGIGQAPWADSPNESEFGQDFFVPRATLEIDGRTIIKDGTPVI
jgi:leucyl aminopeptidase (aminopeptidase T)